MTGLMTAAAFVLAAVVNLLPAVGVMSAARLETMYRVTLASPDLVVLMRHRAVLLAIVGGLLLAAAFRSELRAAALVAGLASILSFVALAAGEQQNAALRTITYIDVAASLLLAVAAVLHWSQD